MRQFSFIVLALALTSGFSQERLDALPDVLEIPEDVPLKSESMQIPTEDELEPEGELMQVGATTMDIDGDVVEGNNGGGGAGAGAGPGAAGGAGGAGPAGHQHNKFAIGFGKKPNEKDPVLMKALNAVVADLTVQGNGVVKNRKWLGSVQEMLESYAKKYKLVEGHVKKLKFDMSNLALTKRKIHNVEVQQEIKKHVAMVKVDINDVENILQHVTGKYDTLGEKIDSIKDKVKGLKARLKKLKPDKKQRAKEAQAEEDASNGKTEEEEEEDEGALMDIEGDEMDENEKKVLEVAAEEDE